MVHTNFYLSAWLVITKYEVELPVDQPPVVAVWPRVLEMDIGSAFNAIGVGKNFESDLIPVNMDLSVSFIEMSITILDLYFWIATLKYHSLWPSSWYFISYATYEILKAGVVVYYHAGFVFLNCNFEMLFIMVPILIFQL